MVVTWSTYQRPCCDRGQHVSLGLEPVFRRLQPVTAAPNAVQTTTHSCSRDRVKDVHTCTVLPRCYIRPARCYAPPPPPPPPYFRAKLLYRVICLHYTPPPRAARAGLRYCSSCACCKCRRVVFVYQACRK